MCLQRRANVAVGHLVLSAAVRRCPEGSRLHGYDRHSPEPCRSLPTGILAPEWSTIAAPLQTGARARSLPIMCDQRVQRQAPASSVE